MASAKQSAHPQKVHTLKRLQPVATLWGISQEATRAGLHISLYFYQGAKAYVPSGLRPRLDQVEDTIQSNFTPLASRVQDVANELIYFADDEVDVLFNSFNERLAAWRSKSSASDATQAAQAVTGAAALTAWDIFNYLNTTAQAVVGATYLTAVDITNRVGVTSGVKAATELLYAGVAKAQEVADPDTATKMVLDAWERFSHYPVVAPLLKTAEPLSNTGLQVFRSFHDTLVANPLYKRAVELSAHTLAYAQHTVPYKLGAMYVYPVLQPVADPAIEKVTKSKVINQTVEFWKPKSAVA